MFPCVFMYSYWLTDFSEQDLQRGYTYNKEVTRFVGTFMTLCYCTNMIPNPTNLLLVT